MTRNLIRRFTALVGALTVALASADERTNRYFEDGILVSGEDPSLAISVDDAFSYLGRHPIAIGDTGAGERFVFADASGEFSRFLIVQFEGFLPGVDDYFRYDLSKSPVVAGYPFRSNAFAFDMSDAIGADPTKESAATHNFLRERGVAVPDQWMMWRSLTVADDAKRKEIIIFYVEDVASMGLTLDDLYRDGSSTPEWRAIQQGLEKRANSAFRLGELDDDGNPVQSSWARIPNGL